MQTTMIRKVIAAAFVALVMTAKADYECKVTMWRGESLSVILPDAAHEVYGSAPGVSVATGTILPVRYLKEHYPIEMEYGYKADRCVYGSKEVGMHFATIETAPDAKPGTYQFGQLVVTVINRVLPPPSQWKYYLDLWQHPWAVSRVHGVSPFSPAHYRAMEPLWRMLAAAGQKTLTVTLVDKPWNRQCYDAYHSMVVHRKGADGKWSFDYSQLDEYIAFGRKCGLGPHISCYTMCPWEYMVDYIDAEGKVAHVKAVPGTPAFDDYWKDFLIDFERHMKEKGYLKDTFIAMDERSPKDVEYIANFIRRYAPSFKIAMAGSHRPGLSPNIRIDSYAQYLSVVDDAYIAEVPERRKQGLVSTYYVCCVPDRPNTFIKSGKDEAFICAFYPAAAGLDGLLRWAYNSWGEDSNVDMTYSRWASGDIAFIYPDGSPSWRFLDLKNGIQHAEKYRILREAGEKKDELDKLAKKFVVKDLLKGMNYKGLRDEIIKLLNQ